MQLRPLGRGAPPVSVVGYGGMHLSLAGRPPEDVALRVIHAGLDAGMTLIDTADVYCLDQNDIGHNERLVAQALGTWSGPRGPGLVATKGGMIRPDGRWERDARPGAAAPGLRALAAGAAGWTASTSTSSMRRITRCRSRRASARWPSCSARERSAGSGSPT